MKQPGRLMQGLGVAWAAACVLAAALPAGAAPQAPAAPRYRLTDLGAVQGADGMVAKDLNDHGEVTGWTYSYSTGTDIGFLYRDGRLQILRPSPPDVTNPGFALNNRGDVVGWSAGRELPHKAYLYRDGAVTDLRPAPVERYDAIATDINDAGMVTGEMSNAGSLPYSQRAFVHDGTQLRLLDIPGEPAHAGIAINNAGEVLVSSVAASDPINFYLYRDGRATRLPSLSTDPYNAAVYMTLNNAGQALGYLPLRGGGAKSFVYDDGAVRFIDAPDQGAVRAVGFNDRGWTVGLWDGHAGFLYRDGRMHAFEDLLPRAFSRQWLGVALRDINEAGQIIGDGMLLDHNGGMLTHSFIATPVPEPVPAALMLAGLGVVAWRLRRSPPGPGGLSPASPARR